MAGIYTDIDNLKREIEKTQTAIKSFHLSLGEIGCRYHNAIACPQSNDAFRLLCNSKIEYDDITMQIESVRQALAKLDSANKQINQTKVSIKDLDNRNSTLIASLGAVACELASQGKLPKSLEKCLESAKTFDAEMQRRIAKRDAMDSSVPAFLITLADKRVEAMKKNINGVFYQTGKRLLASPDIKDLQNDRILAIIDELEMLKTNRKSFRSLVQRSEMSISSVQNSLRENKTLKEMISHQAEVKKKLDTYYTQYGSIIAKDMDTWLDSSAPQELKDICEQIRTENRRLAKQNLNMDYLLAQKDIELSENQKSQLSVQLSHLLEQRTSVDRQIHEVRTKIASLEQNLTELQNRQQIATKKATEVNTWK